MDSRSKGELIIDEGPSLQFTETPSPEKLVKVRVNIGEFEDNVLDYEPEEEGTSTGKYVSTILISEKYTT